MTGFFSFNTADYDRPGHSIVGCPNCGTMVNRSAIDNHVCQVETVEAHHVRLFNGEFSRGDNGNVVWDRFDEWLETPAGRFAVFDAERTRP